MDIEDIEEINNRIHYIVYTSREKKSIRKIKKELRKQVENYWNWSDEDLILIKNLHFISNAEIKALRVLKYSNRKLSIEEIKIRELEKQLMCDVIDLPVSRKSITGLTLAIHLISFNTIVIHKQDDSLSDLNKALLYLYLGDPDP